MAQRGSVEVVCHPDGSVTVTPTGYTGPACERATKEIEEALGKVTKRERTPAYSITDKTGAKQQVQR